MKSRFDPILAVFFVAGGLLVSFAIFGLFSLGNMEAGMSDGIEGGVESPTPFIMAFAMYFICGVIASLVPLRGMRMLLAVAAHVSPFLAVWLVRHDGWPVMRFFLVPIFIIYAVYGFLWFSMLSRKDAISL
jgi:hypothetical protein